jgi:hypothetical protein
MTPRFLAVLNHGSEDPKRLVIQRDNWDELLNHVYEQLGQWFPAHNVRNAIHWERSAGRIYCYYGKLENTIVNLRKVSSMTDDERQRWLPTDGPDNPAPRFGRFGFKSISWR